MYTDGQLIFYPGFEYHKGKASPKFALILKSTPERISLSLLSSQTTELGEIKPGQFDCYIDGDLGYYGFKPNAIITDIGYAFNAPVTYCIPSLITLEDPAFLSKQLNPIQKGILRTDRLNDILKCIEEGRLADTEVLRFLFPGMQLPTF